MNGSEAQNNVRPGLMACYSGDGGSIQPDSFKVLLDGRDFSSEVVLEGHEVMFTPHFNLEEGTHTYLVQWVSRPGGSLIAQDSTTFTVNSVLTDGSTSRLLGQVANTDGTPLASVILRVNSLGRSTTTAANGRFVFDNLPPGEWPVEVDPSGQSTDQFHYAPVTIALTVVAGHVNQIDRPIFLPAVDTSNGIFVTSDSATAQVITSPDLPGVQVTIPPHTTLTFPNGDSSGVVTMIKIPGDRTPACYGAGRRFPYLISLQPENTILSQPAQLTVPNDLNLPEGKKVAFYSLNKDSGRFAQTGRGIVMGNAIVTDAGSGLATFDWHYLFPAPDSLDALTQTLLAPQQDTRTVCSTMGSQDGALMEDHAIPSYQSLGQARALALHYSSATGVPTVLMGLHLQHAQTQPIPSSVSVAASGTFGAGASYYDPSQLQTNTDDSYAAATLIDAQTAGSGRQAVEVRVTGTYDAPNGGVFQNGSTFAESSITTNTVASVINGPKLYPALGRGWSIANIDRLIDHDRSHDRPADAFGQSLVTGVDIIRGSGQIDSFTGAVATSRIAGANLGFELASLEGGVAVGNASTVNNLGYLQPSEGLNMALLRGDLDTFTDGEFYLPLASLPSDATAIEMEVDFLSDQRDGVADGDFTIEYRYSSTRSDDYGTGADGGFGDYDGAVAYQLAASSGDMIQAGADTGYTNQTGFQRAFIILPAAAVGKKGYLYCHARPKFGFVIGGVVYPGASTALLVDALRFVRTDTLAGTTYTSATGDFSDLVYLESTQTYERRYPHGLVQVFDSAGRQTQTRDRYGNTTTYAYIDATGNGEAFDLASITDPVGLVTTLSYSGGKLATVTDPAGRVTTLTYDGANLIEFTNPDGSTRSFGYDNAGRINSQTDAVGNTRQYAYGVSGRLVQVTRADGAIYHYQPLVSRGIDDVGAIGDSTTPAGLTRATSSDMEDALGHPSQSSLNAFGQPLIRSDALNQQTAFAYNNDRNLTGMTQANGNQLALFYDGKGNLTRTTLLATSAESTITYEPIFNQPTSIRDALNHATDIAYDSAGNPITVTDAQGHADTMTYNSAGQLLTRTDPLGHTTTIRYNSRGLPETVTDPLGRTTTLAYDLAGRVTATTDPAGRISGSLYDPMNRVTQTTAADGGISRYAYDLNGDLLTLTDPNGHARSWTYDSRRRIASATDALGRSITLAYNGQSNLVGLTRRDGTVITYDYDVLNRLKQINLPALPNGVSADTVRMTYDVVGNLSSANDNDSIITNTFDALSRLTQTTQNHGSGASLTYTYDILNRRGTMNDSVGTTTYFYDELNRLVGLTDPVGRAFTFGFDAAGRPASGSLSNGVTAAVSYDAADQLLSLAYAKGSTSIASAGYQYNLTGTRSSEAREDGNTRSFGYDPVDRLLSSLNSTLPPDHNEAFSYDQEGNWTINARVHDAADELTQDANYNYAYDPEGNLIQKVNRTNSADVTNYTYDAQNRLVQVVSPLGTSLYAYDALGRRIARTVNGTTTRYLLDGQNVRLEFDGSGALGAANTHAGLDRLLVRGQGGAQLFFQRDALGSTTALTDPSGAVVERYRYSAFGKVEVLNPDFTPKSGDLPTQPYTYTGREWEPEAALYFNRARFYSPEFGRFISKDPFGEKGGINLYGYTANDPLNATDPNGTDTYFHDAQDTMAGFIDGFVPGLPYDEHNEAMRIGRRIGTDTSIALAVASLPRLGLSLISSLRSALSETAAAADVVNQVPSTLARVVDARFVSSPSLAAARAGEALVTAADDIAGTATSQALASRLTLLDSTGTLRQGPFAIIEFDAPASGLASPVFRNNPGFIQGGVTGGGAREFVLPNIPINQLQNVVVRTVP
jgi:RHS repeat-associated protein